MSVATFGQVWEPLGDMTIARRIAPIVTWDERETPMMALGHRTTAYRLFIRFPRATTERYRQSTVESKSLDLDPSPGFLSHRAALTAAGANANYTMHHLSTALELAVGLGKG